MTGLREMGSGLRDTIAAWLVPLRERRHAARASDELLAMYRTVKADYPDCGEWDLLRLTVMTHSGCDSTAAEAILKRAEESFAEWPVRRELTLCDVVHYVSVTELLSTHEDVCGVHANIGHVVASHVPHELCVSRGKT